jgi:hypothetical protein
MNGQFLLEGQTPEAMALFEREARIMETLKAGVLQDLASLKEGKTVYDMHLPWWQKHIFGDASYAHELFKKAARAASLVAAGQVEDVPPNQYADKLEDHLLDALNFIVMWLAWRRYVQAKGEEDEGSSHSTTESHKLDFG